MRRLIPPALKPVLRKIRLLYHHVVYVRNSSDSPCYCPVCDKGLRQFKKIPYDTACFVCESRERHRVVWLFFRRVAKLFDDQVGSMLHVAPEKQFVDRLTLVIGPGYLTADLMDPAAMVKMDITAIQYPDDSFDSIYCSHVLEHVPDDRLAMREFARVLKPSGFAILLVPPFTADKTFEDPSITDPEERLRLFGQNDHVRVYGRDFEDRLTESGLEIRKYSPSDFLKPDEMARLHVTDASQDVYYCSKKQAAGGREA